MRITSLSKKLELKIIPAGVFAICVILMILFARFLPSLTFDGKWRFTVGFLLICIGTILILVGINTFKKAQTPKTPSNPEVAKRLVTWGIYKYTRNPMYLGGTTIATGIAFLIGNYTAFLFAALFMVYIDFFQIRVEERILEKKSPQAFAIYARKTRRWI